ncbi:MAG: exodeoxyribonuclease VII large subunit [Polyangiaceae bacterium]|nr:exodeoxyribonuclease VII large subunit [Polyangiaceae bacterium]
MSQEVVIGVAELDRRLRRAVEQASGREWVEGEVGSLRLAPSGHAYFTLKDEAEDAVIDCVAYRNTALGVRRHLSDGAKVQVFGRATVWAPRGRLQLVVDRVRPVGRGALLEALERLKQQLAQEGLFDTARKRPLPASPRVVGVVTSGHGAAFADVRTVAFRRGGVRLVLAPALVQGEGAAESIVRALDLIERYPGLDVLIVGRGGGSTEDLMAFNDERVVRRVAGATVPVVSAVGHEIDVTLCDLVADVRAATPSQAAELVIPDASSRLAALKVARGQLLRAWLAGLGVRRSTLVNLRLRLSDPRFLLAERQQSLDEFRHRLERAHRAGLARRRGRLSAAESKLLARHPRTVLAAGRGRIGPLAERLRSLMTLHLAGHGARLRERRVGLEALSPLAILERGYAIVTRSDGRALTRSDDARSGERLGVRLHQGHLGVEVVEVLVDDEGGT